MSQPKVSFVVPVKDRLEWIAECCESLLAQTVQDVELVIVDDGSTDGTFEFVREYYAKEPRVQLIRNETNLGAGPSRNLGTARASAPLIGVCDSDDLYPVDRAEEIIKFFEKYPKNVMMTAPYLRVDYCNRPLDKFHGAQFDEKAFKETGAISYFCHPAAAYTRVDFDEIGGYKRENNKATDDLQFVTDWIKAGKKIVCAEEKFLLLHRVLPDSIMSKMRGFDPKWTTA